MSTLIDSELKENEIVTSIPKMEKLLNISGRIVRKVVNYADFPAKIKIDNKRKGWIVKELKEWFDKNKDRCVMDKIKGLSATDANYTDYAKLKYKKLDVEVKLLENELSAALGQVVSLEELKNICNEFSNIVIEELKNTVETFINSTRNDDLIKLAKTIEYNIRDNIMKRLDQENNRKAIVDSEKVKEIQEKIEAKVGI